jgi:DNA-binding CsgD family transcriptional regulator
VIVGVRAGQLVGRQREQAVLERLLDNARADRGAVLVIHGDAGVGKTALLEYAVAAAEDFRVVRTTGVEREMTLDYAALQRLCLPILELIDLLPDLQRDALGVAFGLRDGQAPSSFLVGLATLGLLSEAAAQQRLFCVVDDAQWLDDASARALEFAARRLLVEGVAVAFATREVGIAWARFPQLRVQPLGRRDARALLESVLAARLDESVLARIIAESGGNPLALLELPHGLTPAQLAGGFGLPAALPMSTRIEQSFMRRLAPLGRHERRLLLLAAADPLGDPALLWRAAQQLEIPETAALALESEGLLTIEGAVTFRHPLVRSAVYGAAEPSERREVHGALSEATDPQIDPDRRAWHRAQAAFGPDEQVAVELERSAERAQARGGLAAAAAFLERASALTPTPERRAQRTLAAAQMKFLAGALDDAFVLLSSADVGALGALDSARVALLRAQIAFVSTHGSDAPAMFLDVARRLTPLSLTLASETYLEAMSAAFFAGRLAAPGARSIDVAVAAMAAPKPPVLRGQELLLEGFATFFCEGYEASVPILRSAQSAFDVSEVPLNEQLRLKWFAANAAIHTWDDAQWEAITEPHVLIARDAGALGELPLALTQSVYVHLFAGDLTTAGSLVDEISAATELTGVNLTPYGAVGLAALRGREPEAVSLIDGSREDVARRGEGIGLSMLDWARAILYNGLGRYDEACAAAVRVFAYPHDLGGPVNWGMIELIEAAVRAGTPEAAAVARARLSDRARASGTDWVLGLAARSEALFIDDQRAEELYIEAVARLGRTRMAVDLARAHLLYGEWLRRQRRRLDAREQLRTAYDYFSAFGMEAFAERARVELEATGERARKRAVQTLGDLTPQETQIARLARDGLSNAEIGARMFISKHTVEYHLHKVFAKLGINSRTKLAQAVPPEVGAQHLTERSLPPDPKPGGSKFVGRD